MSHSVAPLNGDTLKFASLTIMDYTAGGEPVSASDVGVTSVDGVFMASVSASQNSLGTVLFPVLTSGKIMLFRFISGAPVEIPTTAALNAVIPCLVHVSVL